MPQVPLKSGVKRSPQNKKKARKTQSKTARYQKVNQARRTQTVHNRRRIVKNLGFSNNFVQRLNNSQLTGVILLMNHEIPLNMVEAIIKKTHNMNLNNH